jgi:cysteine desulfurase
MSTNRRIYLDFNATAPLVPAARDAMIDAMSDIGNPSSVHAEGRRVRDRVERARNQVAGLLGRPREESVFTSGGTEANWLGVTALAAAAEQRGLPKIVATTPIEHPSLRGAVEMLRGRGWEVALLRADVDHGVAKVGEMPRVGLLAAALVNHETGMILGEEVRAWAREIGALVHLDAVQAAGKLRLDDIPADSVVISSHKIGGPQGAGALAITIDNGLPLIDAGHQERGRRPGTENTLGIIGFGAAAAQVDMGAGWRGADSLGRTFEQELVDSISGTRIQGRSGARVHSTVNARFEGARGEAIVMALDIEGISVATGAACTSGSIQPSAVLLGLGLSEAQAREGVRFSLGPTTTREELNRVLEVLPRIVERARRHHRQVN